MLQLVLWSIVVLAIVGVIVFLVLRTRSRIKPQIPIRQAIDAAKAALKDKEHWPKLYFVSKEKLEPELIAYNALKKDDLNKPGTYRMQWPHLDLQYTVQQHTEDVKLHLNGQDKNVTLLYVDGELASMALGDEVFRREDFEMRHAVNQADLFRKHLRKQLCSGYGTHAHKKLAHDKPSSQYEVNAAGEIKLAELPAPKPK